jgi:Flp pilus assembly protein TadG
MRSLFKNNRGATAVEFALVALPVLWFILGIVQTGWIVWIDNLLYISVHTAARCGAVNSTTLPCKGSGSTNMINTAKLVFQPMSSATFTNNSNCSGDGGAGLVGTYNVSIVFVVNLQLTAQSCYPTVPVPS